MNPVAAFGILGNLLTFYVLYRRRAKTPPIVIMVSEIIVIMVSEITGIMVSKILLIMVSEIIGIMVSEILVIMVSEITSIMVNWDEWDGEARGRGW